LYLEQVSHHPPAFATHTEGQSWTLYQEFTMASKFRGQYLSVTPLGTIDNLSYFIAIKFYYRLLSFDIQKQWESLYMEKNNYTC